MLGSASAPLSNTVIYLEPGTYELTKQIAFESGSYKKQNIRLIGKGNAGDVVLTMKDKTNGFGTVSSNGLASLIRMNGVRDIVIKNLTIDGVVNSKKGTSTAYGYAFNIIGSRNITIEDVTVKSVKAPASCVINDSVVSFKNTTSEKQINVSFGSGAVENRQVGKIEIYLTDCDTLTLYSDYNTSAEDLALMWVEGRTPEKTFHYYWK